MTKGGISRRVISFLAGLFVRFFYDPDLLRWLLRFSFPFKKRVAILGGNYPGCELGETLMNRGKEVAIIEESGRIGADIGMMHRWLFIKNLREGGAKLITKAKVLEITDRGVKIERAGTEELVEADTVVKVGITKNLALAEELKAKVPVLYLVGDCTDPGMLMEAVASGFLVGQKV
jgi:pyruvate/2-oxoglutarate dehydrogenase complex dihydrolipoamide dehydrogenase (E3) component